MSKCKDRYIYIQGKGYLRRTCILYCKLDCDFRNTFSLNVVLLSNAFSIFITNKDVINILRPKCQSLWHLNPLLIRHHRSLWQLDLLLRSYDRPGYNKGNKE